MTTDRPPARSAGEEIFWGKPMKPTRNRHETDGNRQKLAAITPISWRASRSVHECADRARRSAAKGLIFGVLSPSLLARCGAGWSRSDRLLNLGETDETDTIFGKSDRPTGPEGRRYKKSTSVTYHIFCEYPL